MSLDGLERLLATINGEKQRRAQAVVAASREVADYLQGYAKTHTGKSPRKAGWIYPPGMATHGVNRVKSASAPGGYVYPKGQNRRWRQAGVGWGDVTGHLRKSIRARVRAHGRDGLDVILSANTPYAPKVELGYRGRWRWLAPAVMDNRRRIVQVYERRLRAR